MVSKRPPMPNFDDKWNMEIWASNNKISTSSKQERNCRKFIKRILNLFCAFA